MNVTLKVIEATDFLDTDTVKHYIKFAVVPNETIESGWFEITLVGDSKLSVNDIVTTDLS